MVQVDTTDSAKGNGCEHRVGQPEAADPTRERLNPFVLPSTARLVKAHAALRGLTHGQLIDELVAASLPAVGAAPEVRE